MRRFTIIITLIGLSMLVVRGQGSPVGRAPLIGVPDINGRATLLIKPLLPGDVLQRHDGVTLTLLVIVDDNGNVTSAKCSLTCPSDVAPVAESAAALSKFRPLIVNGEAVEYSGTLMYTLAVARVNWYRFGTALYSVYLFDNLSVKPVAEFLTPEYSSERAQLAELDNGVELELRWKTINSVRDSIKTKIAKLDIWLFDLGMAVRKVSAPFQSDRKLVRAEVQQVLADLGKFADSAPPEAKAETVQAIRTASQYVITETITNRDLSKEVFKLVSAIDPDPQPIRRPR